MKKVKSPIGEELRKKLIELSKKFDLDLLVLFGSRARGDFTKNSDWDFAFLRDEKLNNNDKEKLFDEIMAILNDENIDLIDIDLTETPPKLIFEILKDGFRIYEKNKKRIDRIYENVYFDYIDLKNLLEEDKKKFLTN